MPIDVKNLPLVRYLKELNEERYHQLISLRSEAETWLRYVPQTFPHFTDHTVRHCDAIVQQLGLILVDPASGELVAQLGAVELHMLLAAAYLHDTGMVVPDSDKESILASADWKDWVATAGNLAWEALDQFRRGTQPADPDLRNFRADVQLRAMIATFVRTRHAERSRAQVHKFVESFLLGNGQSPQFWAGVAELCAGHGMSAGELADPNRFPLAKTVDAEPVAFRWLAVLLRFGDLLDMDISRSCATLQLAAGTLPAESQPHWTQYSRIKHSNGTPYRIEFRAECETPDEHRLLLDWFRWIHQESQSARPLLAGQQRHPGWSAPWASLDSPDPTLVVEPGPSAPYFAHDWKLELDTNEILNRLVRNTYPALSDVLRELIQNSADALRCAVSERLISQGQVPPEDMRDVDVSVLAEHVIEVRTRHVTASDDTLMKDKHYVELIVADNGSGMSMDIIRRFLLQAGRSYYQSEEFLGRHRFPASSRFGIGFLSVLGVSNHVVLTTRQRDSSEGITLTLTGPENYLLVERAPYATAGTTVTLRLSQPVESGWLRNVVRGHCHRLEFGVRVDDFEQLETVVAEDASDHEAHLDDVSEPGARLIIRAERLVASGAEGAIYFFVGVAPDGREDYSRLSWAQYRLPVEFPNAQVPTLPSSVVSANGIVVRSSRRMWESLVGGVTARIDVRKRSSVEDIQRNRIGDDVDQELGRVIISEVGNHLSKHLANRGTLAEHDWRYLQALGRQYELPFEWYDRQMNAISGWAGGEPRYFGIRDLLHTERICSYNAFLSDAELGNVREVSAGRECLLEGRAIAQLPPAWRKAIFEQRSCTGIDVVPGVGVVSTWSLGHRPALAEVHGGISVVDFPTGLRHCLGLTVNKTTNETYTHVVVNRGTQLGDWIQRVLAAEVLDMNSPQRRLRTALEKVDDAIRYPSLGELGEFFERLREAVWLPASLSPPDPTQDLENHQQFLEALYAQRAPR